MKDKEQIEQGISINVIVVAAIALLVLVVLSVVFLGRAGVMQIEEKVDYQIRVICEFVDTEHHQISCKMAEGQDPVFCYLASDSFTDCAIKVFEVSRMTGFECDNEFGYIGEYNLDNSFVLYTHCRGPKWQ